MTSNRAKYAKPALLLLMVGLAAVAGWACGSKQDDGSSSATSDAEKIYTDKVHPSLAATCKECHATGKNGAPVFLGESAESSYVAIEGFPGLISAPNVSPIVQKGAHSGPALTQTQTDLVTLWLKAEVTSRKLGADPGVPKNLRAAFKAFGACMDFDRWKELKLNTVATTDTENNQGKCYSCHNHGEASMYWSQDADDTFAHLREFPYVQRLVVGTVKDDGSFESIEASRRILDKGTEAQQPQSNAHPRFSLSSELAGNLNTYVLETISNMAANRCQNVSQPDAGADASK